ncbi:MAG: SDR family oxidoreductase [Anaerolineae bacterium]|nr:MAG: SDR family oxidoreductase [Anaerolineae bacterium]
MGGQFEGKVALITGSGSGIGRASALAFARNGAKVIVADLNVEGGEETVHHIQENDGKARFVKTDVTKEAEVEALVNSAVELYGGLDCAHNNVGQLGIRGAFTEHTEEHWDNCIDVNLRSVWLCMKFEIKHMAAHGGGAIVNTSSLAGLSGSPGIPFYATAKHGVNGLTKSVALEYAKEGIRINIVSPGVVLTPPVLEYQNQMDPQALASRRAKIPLGRAANPDEIADAVVWLCSEAASYIVAHVLVVDGGMSALPS